MVSTSLYTALSGLRAHQKFIDVVGNNIANVNTAGFRGSRTTFTDVLSHTMAGGTSASGNMGGSNPIQLGLGAQVGSIDMNTSQGTLMETGRPLDVAIQGKGFFTLTDGNQSYYTRVGAFGVDTNRSLVDLRTGLRVLGIDGNTITVPAQDTIPAQESTSITLEGNLPATVSGPLAETMSSATSFKRGYAATTTSSLTATTAATGLFNLSTWNASESFSVKVNEKVTRNFTITKASFGNQASVTINELVSHINSQLENTGSHGAIIEAAQNAGGDYFLQFKTNKLGNATSIKLNETTNGRLDNLGLSKATETGSEESASTTTGLNDLVCNTTDYINGDQIEFSGKNAQGNTIGDTFVYGSANDGTTLGDMIAFLNSSTLYDSSATTGGSTAALDAGIMTITANDKGTASLALGVSDGSSTGASGFPSFTITQDGTGPDKVSTAIDIYDALGRSHSVTIDLTRSSTSDRVWTLSASVPPADGEMYSGSNSIGNITFDENGSFLLSDSPSLTFDWKGMGSDNPSSQDEDQAITVSLGTPGSFNGLTMMGDSSSAAATDQDGYAPGELINVSFEGNGALTGYYSNGHSSALANLRIALFGNESGLSKEGDTLYSLSPNSDDPIFTTATTSGSGTVTAGVLENSNVDIAEEFVRLIEAQRGFQANARVISTTDKIMAELVNIVR